MQYDEQLTFFFKDIERFKSTHNGQHPTPKDIIKILKINIDQKSFEEALIDYKKEHKKLYVPMRIVYQIAMDATHPQVH